LLREIVLSTPFRNRNELTVVTTPAQKPAKAEKAPK
jgi:hypothetical protein